MVAKAKATKTMTDENQTVEFDELEEERTYRCCNPENQHFLEVIRKEDHRVIFETFDYEFSNVGTLTPRRWNPNQYEPVGITTHDGLPWEDL